MILFQLEIYKPTLKVIKIGDKRNKRKIKEKLY